MKVLHLSGYVAPQIGGIPRFLSMILPALRDCEVEVDVLAVQPEQSSTPHGFSRQLARAHAARRTYNSDMSIEFADLCETITGCADRIAGSPYAQNWDVVHSHTDHMLAARIAGQLHVPHVATMHALPPPEYGRSDLRTVRRLVAINSISCLVAVGAFSARRIADLGGVVTAIIENPVHRPRIQVSHSAAADLRDSIGVSSDSVVICLAQRPTKPGLNCAIEMVGALRRATPNVSLIVCGPGDPPQSSLSLISEMCLDERVHFCSLEMDTMELMFAVADVVVLADKNEMFGLAAVEAAVRNKWVVCPDRGGPASMLSDCPSVRFVDVEKSAEFAACIAECVKTPAPNSSDYFEGRFDTQTAACDYAGLYRSLLRGAPM